MTAKKWPRGVSRSKLKSSFCVFDSCLTESEEKFMGNAPPDAAHVITNRSYANTLFSVRHRLFNGVALQPGPCWLQFSHSPTDQFTHSISGQRRSSMKFICR